MTDIDELFRKVIHEVKVILAQDWSKIGRDVEKDIWKMIADYVRKEWKHALARQKPGFIRPVYWEKPLPEPPDELKEIHFTYCPMD